MTQDEGAPKIPFWALFLGKKAILITKMAQDSYTLLGAGAGVGATDGASIAAT